MTCQNATINPKNVDDRCFQYTFTLTQDYKKIKNPLRQLSGFNLFLDLHNWKGTEHLIAKNKNVILFEKIIHILL